jgi:cbb3-type cytochrome oxidase subunit 1
MPRLSIFLIRAALIHFGIGFTIGALILYNKGIPAFPWIWRLLPVHVEMLIFGWMAQLAMGVSFFALPRFPDTEKRYGKVWLGWISFALLNTAIIVMAFAYWQPSAGLAFASRMMLITSAITYVLMIFPRVKPFALENT